MSAKMYVVSCVDYGVLRRRGTEEEWKPIWWQIWTVSPIAGESCCLGQDNAAVNIHTEEYSINVAAVGTSQRSPSHRAI